MKKLILSILFIALFAVLLAPERNELIIIQTHTESDWLNWSNIDFWLSYYQVEFPEVVKAQIWLETGNLTSKYCQENSNLFGMNLPKIRPTVAVGKLDGMAYYESWVCSIRDYSLWQRYFYRGGNYLDFLQRHGYAADPLYVPKLQNYLNERV